MSNSNGALLKQLFQLAEEDNVNHRLEDLFETMISEMQFKGNKRLDISFKNGVDVIITYNFDLFYMYISDPKFYQNEETAYTPMGVDRVTHYLAQIANYKFKR